MNPDPRRRTYVGRQAVYLLLALIFAAYGFEAWHRGVPSRFQEVSLYSALWWQVMFTSSAVLTALQLGRWRPPKLVESAWLFFGTITAFGRAAQLAIAYPANDVSYLYGTLFWILVGANIVVALDHRIAYRSRVMGRD